jgi:hypothetical protein
MKKFILITVGVLVAIVSVFAIAVALQPSDFRVERSATIAAAPAVVFEQVNDFHNWEAWSPWAKLDPNCKNSFEGPSSGKDAVFTWDGNDKVGAGKMTILESKPSELVRIKLEFVRPFAATNTAEFAFKPAAEQTAVTWSMSGQNNFVGKAFCLFMNMDKHVGGDFEKGLASMKQVAEAKGKQ